MSDTISVEPPRMTSRRTSDIMSGLSVSKEQEISRYAGSFSEDELSAHFATFKSYDLDDVGFITPDNLMGVMMALEVPCTEEQVSNMIEEVAILSGHDNDGKLSFRDYIRCLEYEKMKDAVNSEKEAVRENRLSQADASADAAEPVGAGEEVSPAAAEAAAEEAAAEPEEGEGSFMRGSSFAVLDKVARGRITRFEQVIQETVKKDNVPDAQVRAQARFASKLAKFQQEPTAATVETLYKRSVKEKLNAFETANKAAPADFKKTWKKVGAGNYKLKTQIAGAPPPKRNVADLP